MDTSQSTLVLSTLVILKIELGLLVIQSGQHVFLSSLGLLRYVTIVAMMIIFVENVPGKSWLAGWD